MVEFSCRACGKVINAPENAAGKKGTCPACGAEVMVPLAAPVRRASSGIQVEPGGISGQFVGTQFFNTRIFWARIFWGN